MKRRTFLQATGLSPDQLSAKLTWLASHLTKPNQFIEVEPCSRCNCTGIMRRWFRDPIKCGHCNGDGYNFWLKVTPEQNPVILTNIKFDFAIHQPDGMSIYFSADPACMNPKSSYDGETRPAREWA